MRSISSRHSPWPALWTMMLGFFMILVDSSIVSVAIPAISAGLNASYNEVIWVNSSYLLAYAVPLLITGRLGDRFGPKTLYISGLAVFTAASAACGLANSVTALIIARAVQGLGGAMVTPQTMAVMIRTFTPQQRGGAMGVWGAVAGVATIVGPLLGGVLVDAGGWEWIFFVNVPVGILGLVLAWVYVPTLDLTSRSIDWLSVVLSAIGMFCLVFGIQEGDALGWDYRVIGLIVVGLVLLAVFLARQSRIARSKDDSAALVPLRLFDDRNFALACVAISTVGFAISTFAIPWMIYVQRVQELSPSHAALLVLPSGLVSLVLAPLVGRMTNTRNPKPIAIAGMAITSASIALTALITTPEIDPAWMLAVSVVSGVGNSMMWGPLSMIATRNLDPALAGAGSSVYNTVRQLGAVVGSAVVAAFMSSQLASRLGSGDASLQSQTGVLPPAIHEPFALAMSLTLWVPTAVLAIGAVVAMGFTDTKSWNS